MVLKIKFFVLKIIKGIFHSKELHNNFPSPPLSVLLFVFTLVDYTKNSVRSQRITYPYTKVIVSKYTNT